MFLKQSRVDVAEGCEEWCDVAEVLYFSPNAVKKGIFAPGAKRCLRVGDVLDVDIIRKLVKECGAESSSRQVVKGGSKLTVFPGWLYVVHYLQSCVCFTVESVQAKVAVQHAGAHTLVAKMAGLKVDRLGVSSILMRALSELP